ncbi:hypothetical protein [Primorskyibacter flagellatus]|uniref:SH3 domain-containing protein n=1 Tax=Primorskyibacter flagellatus TaxID=1387277 RepID=A0A1W1Z4K2_9RHOB|nr:hypothetical protein [Primorskyibacter flagellatus]SMC43400.1 hypothetical protein SAMN06295998_101246 [Primorskyibacter flagellatus]
MKTDQKPNVPVSMRVALISACLSAASVSATGPVLAQAAEPWETGCLVTGLDPNGDGFLSVRRGPGSQHQEIARVHNGDALFFDNRQCQGKWCFAEGGSIENTQSNIRGWFYTAWCEFYP